MKDANAFGYENWNNAMTAAATLDAGDFAWLTDGSSEGEWRLPTMGEWEAFVDTTYTNPALSNAAGDGKWSDGDVFNNVQTMEGYWSSTGSGTSSAWYVSMSNGNPYIGDKDERLLVVWPVRSDN